VHYVAKSSSIFPSNHDELEQNTHERLHFTNCYVKLLF